MRVLLLAGFIAGLLLSGCANQSDTAAVTSVVGPPAPTPTVPNPSLVGKVFLGIPVAGARVSVLGEDGSPLSELTTNQSGNFFMLQGTLPSDFRVVATVPGSTLHFSQEVRGYRGGPLYLQVNIPTTLVSNYLRSHPGSSLEQAESQVRRALDLPDQINLSYGIEESPDSPFSHVACWRAAGQAGGWAAFSAQLLQRVEAGNAIGFVLTRAQLQSAITGLEPGLQATAEDARQLLASYMVFSGLNGGRVAPSPRAVQARDEQGPPPRVPPPGGEARDDELGLPEAAEGSGFFYGVAQGAVGNLLSVGLSSLASKLGLNIGTSAELKQISQQLTNLQDSINQLDASTIQAVAGQAVMNLNDSSISPLVTLTNTIQNQSLVASPTNTVFTPNSAVTSMLSALQGFSVNTSMTDIQASMLGSGGSLNFINSSQIYVLEQLGLDQPAEFGGSPFRCNNLLRQCLQTYGIYAGYQLLGLNLLVEQAHANSNQATAVQSALLTLVDDALSLKRQRQQQGLPLPSEQIIVDLEFGVMWYNQVQAAAPYTTALAHAQSLQVPAALLDGTQGTISGWRLPTANELYSLQLRATYSKNHSPPPGSSPAPGFGSPSSYPDFGQAASGLPSLGFLHVAPALVTAVDPNINLQPTENAAQYNNGFLWFTNWQQKDNADPGAGPPSKSAPSNLSFGAWTLSFNQEKSVGEVGPSGSPAYPYLICRSLTQPLMSPYGSDTKGSGSGRTFPPPPSSNLPAQVMPPALSAPEHIAYGQIVSLSAPTTAPAPPVRPSPVTALIPTVQLTTQVTGQITQGGSFTVGNQTSSEKVNLSIRSAQQTGAAVSTTTADGLGNALAAFVSFVSSNNLVLNVFNVPGLNGLGQTYQNGSTELTAQCLVNVTGGKGVLPFVGLAGTLLASQPTALPVTGALPAGNLTSIAITPRNVQITNVGPNGDYAGNLQFHCTGYYSDGTVRDLTQSALWTISNPAAQQVGLFTIPPGQTVAPIYFGSAPRGELLWNVPPPANLAIAVDTVQAAVGNLTDSVQIQIGNPP